MRVYINRMPIPGPWGGGSKILTAVIDELNARGHWLTNDLNYADAYVCFDPRENHRYADYRILRSIATLRKKPLIQRVGDLGTHGKPELTELLKSTLNKSDLLIFPSEYAKDYFKGEFESSKAVVVPNGPMKCFYEHRNENLSLQSETLRIVTHHWSMNEKKGFSTYDHIDKSLNLADLKISMTYIGRLPENLTFRQIKHVSPMDESQLAIALPRFDVYLTASEDEAGANHVLEAAAAGLPILASFNGGSIPEYCRKFGAIYGSFNPSMLDCLRDIRDHYQSYKTSVLQYNRTVSDTAHEIVEAILEVTSQY